MKILVVDDERPLRKAYARWLNDHDVVELSAVSTAIDFMENSNWVPDVIICDNTTGPGPRGIDFAEQLSQSDYKGKFILCTGDPRGNLEKRIEALGYKFFTKPVMLRDISEAINN